MIECAMTTNLLANAAFFAPLQKACIEVLGKYDHRRVALQEVRFAVEEATRGRDFQHRVAQRFSTTCLNNRFDDVKSV